MSVQNITVTAGESATITFLKNTAAADDQMVFVISHLGIPLVIKRREIAINANTSYVVTLLPSETAALPGTGAIHSLQKVGDVESVLFTGSVTANSATLSQNIENALGIVFRDFHLTADGDITLDDVDRLWVFGTAVKSSIGNASVIVETDDGNTLFDKDVIANETVTHFYGDTQLDESAVKISPVLIKSSSLPIHCNIIEDSEVWIRLYYWREQPL